LLSVTLFVVVIAQSPELKTCAPGVCGGAAMVAVFQQSVQRVLGANAHVQSELVTDDPPDAETLSRAPDADGVVELSFSSDGQKAHLHCYVPREGRWIDREISFGESRGSLRSEISERGRLLGFAVATMYAAEPEADAPRPEPEPDPTQEPETKVAAPPPAAMPTPSVVKANGATAVDRASPRAREPSRAAEFGAIISSGLGGQAPGIGASAGFRLGLRGPLWGRVFIAGRSGNIPAAQANTRTALLGGGLALALLPRASSFELGLRADAFASYFDASHLSEDDLEPDLRSRWQAGADLIAEAGYRFTVGAGVFLGAGIEGMLGKTEIYTHHNRVAVIPPFRAVAELGFRTYF
jgi:hypothetical protein